MCLTPQPIFLGQIIVGYGMGWSSPVFVKLQNADQTPLPRVMSNQEISWLGSVLYVGAIIGPHTTSYFSNTVGRKPCLLFGGLVAAVSFLIYAVASNLAMLYTVRIVSAYSLAVIYVTNLTYVGEIASTPIRGILLIVAATFDSLGYLVVNSVGLYASYAVINYIGLAMSLLFICGVFFFVPETPLFLAMKGHDSKVKKVLVQLSREEDIEEILSQKTNKDVSKLKKLAEIITVKSNRKALLLTVTLNVLQQLSGIIIIPMFATTIFGLAELSLDASISTVIMGGTQFLSSCIAPYFIERSGRKMLLLISTSICCLSLILLGTFFYLDRINSPFAANLKWLPLVTLIVYSIGYGFGFATVPITLVGEMFTPSARSVGATLSITISWLSGFGITFAFGSMLGYGAHVVFWFFSCACAAEFMFTLIFVPETKGKSLFEIQEILSR